MRTTGSLVLAIGVWTACGGDPEMPDLMSRPSWDPTLPDARELGVRRGLAPARGIIHLHSPFSHDACDGKPRNGDGTANEPCLQDLRAALCTTRQDFAAVTDHFDSMADEDDFGKLFNMRAGDQPVMAGSDQIASRITCPDGHQLVLSIGSENNLMPLMLDRHIPGTAAERRAMYDGTDATAVAAFRDAGARVFVAHAESKSIELLRATAPDGIEIYNLHANIDPEIRRDFLGLDPDGAITAAVEFADTQPGHPEPDLALLSFLVPNQPSIDRWHQLLGDGLRLPAVAGSDAHQNAIPIMLADGERGDSYRRVLRWFGNMVLVTDPKDPVQIEAALAAGRVFAVFEMLGTPAGFDVRAVGDTATYELGDVVPLAAQATLKIDLPTVLGLDARLPTPIVRARVWWIEPGKVTLLAEEESTFSNQLNVRIGATGAYRVEIAIIPHHLGPYLGDLGTGIAEAEMPWIYASPIYVQ
ncbi:MAG TPA: hypothetical protein VIU61_22280 [Kofleriaceae bacterium]